MLCVTPKLGGHPIVFPASSSDKCVGLIPQQQQDAQKDGQSKMLETPARQDVQQYMHSRAREQKTRAHVQSTCRERCARAREEQETREHVASKKHESTRRAICKKRKAREPEQKVAHTGRWLHREARTTPRVRLTVRSLVKCHHGATIWVWVKIKFAGGDRRL